MPKLPRNWDPFDPVHRFARGVRRRRLRVRRAPAEPRDDETTNRHDVPAAEVDQPSQQVGQPGHQITVALIPAAQADLRQLQERTNLSKTDLANRAITMYEFLDAQLRAGHELIIQDNRTGESRQIHSL